MEEKQSKQSQGMSTTEDQTKISREQTKRKRRTKKELELWKIRPKKKAHTIKNSQKCSNQSRNTVSEL